MDAEEKKEISVEDEAVDKNIFKDCSKIAFYRRQKQQLSRKSAYRALLDSVTTGEDSTNFRIIHEATKIPLRAEVYGLQGDIFRLKINEDGPLKPRYEVPDVLASKPSSLRLISCSGDTGSLVLANEKGNLKVHITADPFQIDLISEDDIVISVNSRGQLYFEQIQASPPKRATKENEDAASLETSQENQDDMGLWKEKFRKFEDIKANGPTSIGLDFSLHGFRHLYGIPQHADSHQLKNTRPLWEGLGEFRVKITDLEKGARELKVLHRISPLSPLGMGNKKRTILIQVVRFQVLDSDGDAYRLYNLDVYGYKLHDKMGVYGSVPYLLAHKVGRTVGIFWLNASETLVEINTEPPVESTQTGSVASKTKVKSRADVRWMSESGIIDVFLLTGPTPSDVFKQYSLLTGTQAMPPLFSLGYHQSRWNYEDEQDVKAVDAGFDEHDIPYDVMWLDIEHTRGKRYFTWDKKRFPKPKRMQALLRSKNRKLVVISDPHIKVDPNYSLYAEAKKRGFFVRSHEGGDFEGVCWPGLSSYLDFTNPKVREWYSSLFAFPAYQGSTDILFIWNDMNEPSVFRGPELTMQKNAVHHGNWEHRELHNIYGFYQQKATAEGLIKRSEGKERPFVLTRSFFAGSQKYGSGYVPGSVSIAFVTCPNEKEKAAKEIARGVVEKRLAACVNLIPQITSIYVWKKKIKEDNEVLMMIKTQSTLVLALTEFIRSVHPYEVAEVIALPVEQGNAPYLHWVYQVTKGAVWTGDNRADWSYLKISIPMLLTLSIAGISFCGADVGGFVGNPEAELLVRWYQAGAYQPFFRGHATLKTKRREPWLFGEKHTRLIREAIRARYALLPYWYTLFYHAHVTAEPIMRPLWVEFPCDLEVFSLEDEYMLGSALLVHPVTEPKATEIDVFLPGSDEVWYDFKTFARWEGARSVKIPVALDTIPVFQRGGSVVPVKTAIGKSTGWMTEYPYGLRVALGAKGSAAGSLYLDDGHSFRYCHQQEFVHRRFSFSSGVLSNSCADARGHFPSKCVVEQIVVLGLSKQPSSVTTHSSDGEDQPVAFTYDAGTSTLSLERLSLSIGANWEVHIR